ncbi:MAG: tRNA (adenosine(37)-N6)-threonylcarbamoyltransferase complex transferase subunit TsaD [Chitinophagaceae bacterium]
MATILAIESSCDDTSAAVISDGQILSNIIATQTIHEIYGEVVPEMASRAHIRHIVPIVSMALQHAGKTMDDMQAVAFTQSPGLIGSLLVGSGFAQALAQAKTLPLIAVHHMQAHVLAHFIDDPKPQFPFLCLTVSGGHTQLVLCKDYLDMQVIGETIDDAAGEAFDKAAKMFGLPYPGGPVIDKLAAEGNPDRFSFPVTSMPEYQYSFSGLKTNILYFIRKQQQEQPDFIQQNMADLCASVQQTIIKTLMLKLKKAAKDLGVTQIGIAGGVSANKGLRAALETTGKELGWTTYVPAFQYCTDNAAMVAITAHYKFEKGLFVPLGTVPTARAAFS